MKLASLRGENRDGALVVVSRDLKRMTSAADIAPSLRVALDRWSECKPRLEERYRRLMDGLKNVMPFDEAACHSPLPRSFQWLDGTAYESHQSQSPGIYPGSVYCHGIDFRPSSLF